MYWIVFLSFVSVTTDGVTILEVPSFAEGREFTTLNECQKFLTNGFLNGEFPDLDSRKWQLVQSASGKTISGIHSENTEDSVFNFQLVCVRNPIKE